jgi:hypothetical protein
MTAPDQFAKTSIFPLPTGSRPHMTRLGHRASLLPNMPRLTIPNPKALALTSLQLPSRLSDASEDISALFAEMEQGFQENRHQ